MNGEAIALIQQAVKSPRELGGFLYRPEGWVAEDPAALVEPGPTAKPLTVATLGAVRDYLAANKDALDLSTLIVHVASPSAVWVGGPLDRRSRAREFVVAASATDLAADFLDQFHESRIVPGRPAGCGSPTRMTGAACSRC